jgi:hypothetical protein
VTAVYQRHSYEQVNREGMNYTLQNTTPTEYGDLNLGRQGRKLICAKPIAVSNPKVLVLPFPNTHINSNTSLKRSQTRQTTRPNSMAFSRRSSASSNNDTRRHSMNNYEEQRNSDSSMSRIQPYDYESDNSSQTMSPQNIAYRMYDFQNGNNNSYTEGNEYWTEEEFTYRSQQSESESDVTFHIEENTRKKWKDAEKKHNIQYNFVGLDDEEINFDSFDCNHTRSIINKLLTKKERVVTVDDRPLLLKKTIKFLSNLANRKKNK